MSDVGRSTGERLSGQPVPLRHGSATWEIDGRFYNVDLATGEVLVPEFAYEKSSYDTEPEAIQAAQRRDHDAQAEEAARSEAVDAEVSRFRPSGQFLYLDARTGDIAAAPVAPDPANFYRLVLSPDDAVAAFRAGEYPLIVTGPQLDVPVGERNLLMGELQQQQYEAPGWLLKDYGPQAGGATVSPSPTVPTAPVVPHAAETPTSPASVSPPAGSRESPISTSSVPMPTEPVSVLPSVTSPSPTAGLSILPAVSAQPNLGGALGPAPSGVPVSVLNAATTPLADSAPIPLSPGGLATVKALLAEGAAPTV